MGYIERTTPCGASCRLATALDSGICFGGRMRKTCEHSCAMRGSSKCGLLRAGAAPPTATQSAPDLARPESHLKKISRDLVKVRRERRVIGVLVHEGGQREQRRHHLLQQPLKADRDVVNKA